MKLDRIYFWNDDLFVYVQKFFSFLKFWCTFHLFFSNLHCLMFACIFVVVAFHFFIYNYCVVVCCKLIFYFALIECIIVCLHCAHSCLNIVLLCVNNNHTNEKMKMRSYSFAHVSNLIRYVHRAQWIWLQGEKKFSTVKKK